MAARLERSLKVSLRADDAADALIPDWIAGSSGAPRLREWLTPASATAWAAGKALPKERGLSVLVLRARELQTVLARIAACEDYVFNLTLRGPGVGGGLPSRLDLDLITSRLPNLVRIEISFGPLDRTSAPLVGVAPPLREEAAEQGDSNDEGSDGSPTVFSAPLTVPLDSVLEGILPVEAPALCRALRSAESLTTLILAENMMSDAVGVLLATALTGCMTLRNLDVSNNDMGDVGLSAFAGLLARTGGMGPALSVLSICGNVGGIRTATVLAAALTSATWLTSLDVSMNPFTDAGASTLMSAAAGHSCLLKLGLAGVGASTGTANATAIMLCTPGSILESLDISANEFTEEDVKLIADAAVSARLKGLTTFHEIDVRPAEEPRLLIETLKANRISARPDGVLKGVYRATLGGGGVGGGRK